MGDRTRDPDRLKFYKDIQAGGKIAQINAGPSSIEWLLGELDPRLVFFRTGAPSIEDAVTLLKDAEKWSCRGVYPVDV